MLLAIMSVATVTSIVFVAQWKNQITQNGTCSVETDVKPTINYRWMSIPYFLENTMQLIMLTSGAEFITAQSPYALKGFIFGMTYGLIGLFSIFGFFCSIGLKSVTEKWLSFTYGCTFWYLILVLSVFLVLIIITAVSFKCYKRRQREDVHEQMSAVDYYS